MNKRRFLKLAGSAAIIVAAGGVGFVATRTPKNALQPWENAGSLYTDPMRRALSYAILAPNPHNRQPWLVDLKSDTLAVLRCDLDRLLPATDPFSRQIVIGLGCFLELFSIAAAEQGYRAEIQYFPAGEADNALDQRPIASLSLTKEAELPDDPLFTHILNRHTNRYPYDTNQAISDDLLPGLAAAVPENEKIRVGSVNSGALLDELRTLTRDAMLTEMRTPDAHQESIDLMRIGRAEIEANPDGISLGGAFLETLNLVGVLSRESLADPSSRAYQTGLDMIEQGAMSATGFVWINTLGNDRSAQIEAGRAYMRIALQVSANGLAMQPMSQALQEYAAVIPFYETVHAQLTNQTDERVQMLARLGYADAIGPSPRWPLASSVKET